MSARMMAAGVVACVSVAASAMPRPVSAQEGGQVDAIWPGRDVEKVPGRARIVANDTPPLERRVTLTLTDVTLDAALQELSMRAGVRLIYSGRVVPLERRVTIELEGATVRQALARMLAGVDVEPKVDGERILLVRRAETSAATERAPRVIGTVGGRVRDAASGRVLSHVAVSIIDSTVSASMYTNDSGIYVLPNLPAGEHVIRARLIGFKPAEKTVVVQDRRLLEVDFELEISGSRLQEVVSTATGARRKLELGSDITVIDAATIVREQPVTSVTDLLEGRVPGMIIQRTSGAPGDPARIRLRGAGSPNMSNDPIIIVDGIRVYSQQSGERGNNIAALTATSTGQGLSGEYAAPSPLDYIDPNSIETIEVIKGPSAATLYGQDAANGVIVVTTKKGRAGPTRWTLSAERGMTEMVGDYPELMVRWGHPVADDQRVVCPITNRSYGKNIGASICVADTTVRFQMLNDPELTVLDQGSRSAATIGVSGGTDALTYNVTGSYQDEVGLVKLPDYARERYRLSEGRDVPDWMDRPQNLTRWGATSRLDARLGSTADVSLTANLSRTEQQRSELEKQLGSLMSTYLDRETGVYWVQSGAAGMSEVGETLVDYHERASAAATEFTNGASLNWRPLSWLTTTANAGINIVQRADEILLPHGFGSGSEINGRLRTAHGTSVMSTVDMRALAGFPVRGGFRLQLATGVNYTGESVEDLGANIQGVSDGTESPLPGAEVRFSRGNADQATFGWYIEPSISHRRFWLSTGIRLDGGNTFGTRVKLPAFPKLSLSYLVSDEPFFPWKELVPVLRLRVAYGHAGRQPGPVDRLRLYGAANPVWVNGQFVDGVELSSLGNTQLEPERTEELEGGFDADLLDDRLTLSFTGYRKTTRDALMKVPVPPSVYGQDVEMLSNIGTVLNEGLEASIGAEVVRSDPVTWNVQLSITQQRNEVLELGRGVEPFYSRPGATDGARVAAGYPLFGRWIKPMIGYADANTNGRIEQDEVLYGDTAVFVGGTLPNYQANIHSTLRLLRGAVAVSAGFMYDDGMTQENRVGRTLAPFSAGWQDPNSSLAEQARMWDETGYTWVQTVSTLRFNSLAVTYNVPTRFVYRTGARAMSLSLQGTNLGIKTNYRGIDPNVTGENTANAVVDNGVLPRPRTWQIRLNATY